MRCIQGRAPFWKSDERAHSIKVDLLVCCAVLLIPQVVRFGARPLLLVLATGAIGALTEIGCCLILHREIRLGDWDSVTIGVLIAMLMPANIALAVPAVATVFAIAIAKMPFGGTGNTGADGGVDRRRDWHDGDVFDRGGGVLPVLPQKRERAHFGVLDAGGGGDGRAVPAGVYGAAGFGDD